jgi:hypothetical protein
MQTHTAHRVYQAFGIAAALAVVLAVLGTSTGRNVLGWIYLQSTEAITNAIDSPHFPLDRLNPTWPKCF